jgi:hypothetical protein
MVGDGGKGLREKTLTASRSIRMAISNKVSAGWLPEMALSVTKRSGMFRVDIVVCCEDIDVLQREDVDKGERSLVNTGGYRRKPVFATVLERLYLTQSTFRERK